MRFLACLVFVALLAACSWPDTRGLPVSGDFDTELSEAKVDIVLADKEAVVFFAVAPRPVPAPIVYEPTVRLAGLSEVGASAATLPLYSATVDVGAEMHALQAEIEAVLQLFVSPQPKPRTLRQLVDEFFLPEDRAWAMRVAFCESSAQPGEFSTDARHVRSGASGWFQHLPKFWEERSVKAGLAGADIMDPVANVRVAAWLFYEGGGSSHWYPSESCWSVP